MNLKTASAAKQAMCAEGVRIRQHVGDAPIKELQRGWLGIARLFDRPRLKIDLQDLRALLIEIQRLA